MRDINSMNKVILIGRLGGKPEVRTIPQSERSIARFTLATNERIFNPKTNESQIRAEWHKIIAWGKLGDFCGRYLTQGKQVYIEGKLRTRNWQDRDGNKRSTTEIEAQTVILLGKREEIAEVEPFPAEPAAPEPAIDEEPGFRDGEGEGNDEVPF